MRDLVDTLLGENLDSNLSERGPMEDLVEENLVYIPVEKNLDSTPTEKDLVYNLA